tara:strand:- start:42 stop:263 length:222 start_codon:yes stop_codon:yes gene_type:complete
VTTINRNQGKKEDGPHHRSVLKARSREVAPHRDSDDIHRMVIVSHIRGPESLRSNESKMRLRVPAKGDYASIP